ncbi:unnamed protein product, partial [marine sediment metagenome]
GVESRLRGVGTAGSSASGNLDDVTGSVGDLDEASLGLTNSLKGLFAGFLGIQGVQMLARWSVEAYRASQNLDIITGAIDRQFAPAGMRYTQIVDDMSRATMGLIDNTSLLQNTSRALLVFTNRGFDLADAYVVIQKSAEFATVASRLYGVEASEAFDRVTTALGRLSPERLDDFGIILSLQDEMFAGMSGADRDAAVMEEAIRQIDEQLDLHADALRDNIDLIGLLGVAWSNFFQERGGDILRLVPGVGHAEDILKAILTPDKAAAPGDPRAFGQGVGLGFF